MQRMQMGAPSRLSSKASALSGTKPTGARLPLAQGLCRSRGRVVVRASLVAPLPNDNESADMGGYGRGGEPGSGGFSPMLSVPNVTMKGGGNMGSGGATMERGRLEFVMPTPVVQGPKLDDGGSGGDIGKIIHNGGGGDGGGDDDDDFFSEGDDEGGDGEGGEGSQSGFFRLAIPESYDKFSIHAVFMEWMRTIKDLPAILRQAVEMGLFSSAQLVRFFAMDVRPGVTRTISRQLPPTLARDFVGRLMADPGFVQKLVLESSIAALASMWYEYKARGDKFKNELDLALINSVGLAMATGATSWLLTPSRSYGSIQKFPWQQMLDNLPNCVFDVSGPLRQYTTQARAAGFFAKMAELSAVGALMGTTTSLLSSAAVALRQKSDPNWEPSVAVPGVGRSSGGLAAFFAINANTRYQLMGGLDRFLFDRTNFLWTYMLLSGGARLASTHVGELSRAWWQGLPDPSKLTYHTTPQPRRVRKKFSKRVPKIKPQAAAQDGMGVGEMAALQGMAVSGAAMATPQLLLVDAQQPLDLTLPSASASDPSSAPLAISHSQPSLSSTAETSTSLMSSSQQPGYSGGEIPAMESSPSTSTHSHPLEQVPLDSFQPSSSSISVAAQEGTTSLPASHLAQAPLLMDPLPSSPTNPRPVQGEQEKPSSEGSSGSALPKQHLAMRA